MTTLIAAAFLAQDLAAKLDPLVHDPALSGGLVAVHVQSLTGEQFYSNLGSTRVMPASNEKILSSVYALERLGPDRKGTTRFWKVGNDIVVDSDGDPSLTSAKVAEIRKRLNVQPGAKIKVRQAYSPGFGPGWEFDDLPFRYAARVSAFSMDRCEVPVTSSQGVATLPAWSALTLRRTGGTGNPAIDFDPWKRTVAVAGRLPASGEIGLVAQIDPEHCAARALGGTYSPADTVPDREPDYVHVGDPLSKIAKDCLEPSNNVLAENLLMMAAASEGPLGNDQYATAATRMVAFFEGIGVAKGDLRPQDGSGLSRHNLVTARALAHILRHAWLSPYRDVFRQALPEPGEGTLGSRLKGVRLWAKTGTINSVSALSGVLEVGKDQPVVFSIVMNHYVAPASQARAVQDKIVNEIVAALGQ